MFDEKVIIDIIKTNTPYKDVQYAEETSIDLIHQELAAPRVYVGHLGIKLQAPEDMQANGYNELDNQEILLTSILFICKRSELATVRNNIKAAYIKKSPYPDDSDYSSFMFLEASTVAKTSTKIIWQEIIGTLMPRVS